MTDTTDTVTVTLTLDDAHIIAYDGEVTKSVVDAVAAALPMDEPARPGAIVMARCPGLRQGQFWPHMRRFNGLWECGGCNNNTLLWRDLRDPHHPTEQERAEYDLPEAAR